MTVALARWLRRRDIALGAALGLVALAAVWLVWSWTRRAEQRTRETWQRLLTSVAEDRRVAIEWWVAEHAATARQAAAFPTVVYLASARRPRSHLPFPVEEGPDGHAQTLLEQLAGARNLDEAWIVAGDSILRARGTAPAAAAVVRQIVEQAGEDERVFLIEDHGRPRVAFVSPVIAADGGRGAVVLIESATKWLVPLLGRTTALAGSLELTLVSRTQPGLVALEVGGREGSESGPRLRPAGDDSLAAAALERPIGFTEARGRDGRSVLSATTRLAVPGFGLVARLDADEALARYRAERARNVAFAVVAVLALAALGYALLQRQSGVYERALAAGEDRAQMLWRAVEQCPVSIVITDAHGQIEYVNPQFSRATGYSFEEATGQNPRILKSGQVDAAVYADLWRTISSGREWHGELLNRRKSGELFWEVVSIGPVLGRDGRIARYVAVKEDVTERKRATEALAETQQQLVQSQKIEAVGRLAGGVAHDFNNLLGVITGYGELLSARVPAGDPGRRHLDQILRAAQRAAGLTRQLLAFSRRQVLLPRNVDLNALVAELENMLRRLIGEDVELRVNLAEGLGTVTVDPGQIEQVIMNLAVNARDAMPKGGTFTIETANVDLDATYVSTHDPVKAGPYVLLAASDTGVGMDEATKARAFEPFFTTKPVGEGTGLGLSTVYGIVKQSNGYVWLYSEPGRGTTFKLYFPRIEARPEPLAAATLPPELRGSETVLVVEDQEHLRGAIRESLEKLGYTVREAADGETALEIARSEAGRIHVAVTDVVMPKMSGVELADRLRALAPELPIVFMSGYTADVLTRHGLDRADLLLLEKPFTVAALAAKLRESLASRPGP